MERSQPGLVVDVSCTPRVCWAAVYNGLPLVREVRVQNPSTEPTTPLTVHTSLSGLEDAPATSRLPGIQPHGHLSTPVDLVLDEGELAACTGSQMLELTLEVVDEHGTQVARKAHPLQVLGWDHWCGPDVLPELLAAFVRPRHPLASSVLPAIQVGRDDPLRIADCLRMLHEHLASHALAHTPATLRLRTPEVLLEEGDASELERALWMASCLEAAGVHALVVLHEDSAAVACWLVDHTLPFPLTDDLHPLRRRVDTEEVAVISASPALTYSEAKEAGRTLLEGPGLALDVSAARTSGLRPLPTVLGEPVEVEPPPETHSMRLERWKTRLLDLSMRNRLLNCKDSKRTLPLLVSDLGALEDHLSDGTGFSFEPRLRDRRNTNQEEAQVVEVTCPWCASVSKSALSCTSCGGPLQQQADVGNPLAMLGMQRLEGKVVAVDLPETELNRRLQNLYRSARSTLEETGANTLYIALGLLKFYESARSDTPRTSPILLVPVQITRKGVRLGYTLSRTDEEPLINPTLLQYLHQVHGFESLRLAEVPLDAHGVDVPLVVRRFRKLVQGKKRWAVADAAWVTQLSFTRYMMWRDLDARTGDLLQNLAVRQLLTDDDTPWPAVAELPSPETLEDRTDVAQILCPMDADSSQLSAIVAAEQGHSFVLQGPPGTGKSQTITNLIAHGLAHGRTVLFVSEKMAALDVVHSRLKSIGLAPFSLELHSNKSRKSDVVRQLQEAFDAARKRTKHDWTAHAAKLAEHRETLTAYVRAMHTEGSLGRTAYQAIAELVAFQGRDDLPTLALDLGPHDALDGDAFDTLRHAAQALEGLAEDLDAAESPWRPVGWTEWRPEHLPPLRTLLSEVEAALTEVRQHNPFDTVLSRQTLSDRHRLAVLLQACPGPTDALMSTSGWSEQKQAISTWTDHATRRSTLWSDLAPRWQPALLETPLGPTHERFQAWAEAFVLLAFFFLFFPRRTLGSVATGALGPSPAVRDDLATAIEVHTEDSALSALQDEATTLLGPFWAGADTEVPAVESVVDWVDRFRTLTAALPAELRGELAASAVSAPETLRSRSNLPAFVAAVDRFETARDALEALLTLDVGCWDLDDHLSAVDSRVRTWRDSLGGLQDWVAWHGASQTLRRGGVGALVEGQERGEIEAEDLEEVLVQAVLTWWLDAWTGHQPALRSFHGLEHDRLIERFREQDQESRQLALQEVRSRLSAKVPRQGAASHGEMGILNRELRKKRNHLATRQLFQSIPNVLQRIKPCVLMSPLSVAQYLDPALELFDLVVFDEASQIPPWEAIGAMARGRQVIVVGDSKQLPPTSFFQRGEDDELDEEARKDLESILDECVAIGMPALRLDWHYRSQHEGLITFSNRNYYDDALLTFPCARARAEDLGVRLHLCEEGVYDKGRTRTNAVEAKTLVSDVVTRLKDATHTHSIGVVTFSMPQQRLIEDLIDEARRDDPSLERWFDPDNEERVFVKNLENVQGDERDIIVFSVCYGPDAKGKLSMNFGPLNRQGGERRLNVAITRARRALVMYTSLRPDQIDLSRTSAVGVHHLKAFLAYAATATEAPVQSSEAVGPLIDDIAGRLEEAGYTVDTQIGSSAYRMELAVQHPDDPERYLLGIETDGPVYAATPSARDRDRLRHEVLTRLGWHQHRVWASDWLRHPERSWTALEAALERARTSAEGPKVVRAEPMVLGVEADEREPESHPLYVQAVDLPAATVEGQSFYHRRATPKVTEAVQAVLALEAPLHLNELTRRVGVGWGLTRISAKPKRHVAGLLDELPVVMRGDFVWRSDQDPDTWDTVRVPGDARSADMLPPEEIAAAVVVVLQGAISSTRDDLARDAARLFGITRLGSKVKEAMGAGVDLLVERGVCVSEDGTLTLAR